jgi:tetratricopeptide (TPR) repeat protein
MDCSAKQRRALLILVVLPLLGGCWCARGAASVGNRLRESANPPGEQSGSAKVDPQAWFAKGQSALQDGDLDAAEAAFKKVLAVDPRAGSAYANLGVIAMRRKQWEQALTLLHKAAKLSPQVAGIRLNIGLVQFRSANYAAAIPPLQSVVHDQPDSQQARYLLGLCQEFTEKYSDAVATLEPLWPQMSGNILYLYVLDIAAHSAGNEELDEKALKQMMEVGGDAPEFHLILGKAYLNREETQKAASELDRAVAGNPNLPFVHLNRGIAYMRSEEDELAEAEFLKDITLEPDLADTYEQLGNLYLRMERPVDAEKAFQKCLRRDAKRAAAQFGLGKVYLGEQKYQQALKALDEADRLAPNMQNVHFLRGQVLMRLGRREEAKTELSISQKLLDEALVKHRQVLTEDRVPNPELTQP